MILAHSAIAFSPYQLLFTLIFLSISLIIGWLLYRKGEKKKGAKLASSRIEEYKDPENHKPDYTIAIYCCLIGFFLIVVAVFDLIYTHHINSAEHPDLFATVSFAYHILRDVGIALLSGGGIAIILEVRDVVEKTKRAVFAVIKSDIWLEDMKEEELTATQRKARSILLKKLGYRNEDLNVVSLGAFEERLRNEIYVPYYEKFRTEVQCEEVYLKDIPEFRECELPEGVLMVRKKILTRSTVLNPRHSKTTEELQLSVTLDCPSFIKEEHAHKLCKIEKFIVRVDEERIQDVSNSVKYTHSKSFKKTPFPSNYDTQFRIVSNSNQENLKFEYKDKFYLEFIEIRYVLPEDSLYRRRIIRPSKSTELTYSYEVHDSRNFEVNLAGDCIATTLESNDEVVIREGRQSADKKFDEINIEINDWLLSGNGIFVLHGLTEIKKA